MTTEHNKATPEGNVTCCPHVSDGASSTKEPHNPRHFPRSVRLPAAAQPLSSSPHGSTRLLAKFPVCRTALLAYWINLLLLGITLYFSGVCAEETGVVQDEMPRDVADRAARDTGMVDDSLTTAETAAEITKLPHYPSHDVGAIEKADDSQAIFGATLELASAPRAGNHEHGDTVQIDLATDGVVPTPIQREEVASEPVVAGNEWVMLSQSKTLAARGKIFEARDKVLAWLKADNSVPHLYP